MREFKTVGALANPPLKRREQTRNKAAELFAIRGFGQVSMRELAAHIGIHKGSLYNHIESKESLLFDLIEEAYETLLEIVAQQRSRFQEPESQWLATIEAHIALHQDKGMYLRVAEYELYNLSSLHLKKVQRLRQRYEEHLLSLLIEVGTPTGPFLQGVAHGIVSLLNTLPSLFEHSPLSTTDRLKLVAEVTRGSVAGAIKSVHLGATEQSSTSRSFK